MFHSTDFAVLRGAESIRRFDVFATATKRRTFTPEEKARLVAESFASGDSVCAVARRHRLSASQLYAWRKIARRSHDTLPQEALPAPEHPEPEAREPSSCASSIEIAIGSAIVRVPHGTDPATLKLVLDALRGA